MRPSRTQGGIGILLCPTLLGTESLLCPTQFEAEGRVPRLNAETLIPRYDTAGLSMDRPVVRRKARGGNRQRAVCRGVWAGAWHSGRNDGIWTTVTKRPLP